MRQKIRDDKIKTSQTPYQLWFIDWNTYYEKSYITKYNHDICGLFTILFLAYAISKITYFW